MPHRIVVTGAGGLVGAVVAAQARTRGHEVAAFDRREWDITDPAAARRHIRPGDVVINCAAYTRVDDAEAEPERAHAVNAEGPAQLARACAAAGARLVHIGTDYVFGADTARRRPYDIDDPTGPLSVYGRTKLAGERAVLELAGGTVVRTSWVYAGTPDGTDFVSGLRRRAAEPDAVVEVVADQVGSPTYVGDLVAALLQVAGTAPAAPLLHVANAGAASRYQQARAVFELLGADPARVRPVTGDRHRRPAPRPAYSALSMAGSARAGLTPLRPWRAALAEALGAGPLPSTP